MRRFWILCIGICWGIPSWAQPDSTQALMADLQEERFRLEQLEGPPSFLDIAQAIKIGEWQLAEDWLERSASGVDAPVHTLLRAQLHRLKHQYTEAEATILPLMEQYPQMLPARLLRAKLWVDAWELDSARGIYLRILEENAQEEAAVIGLGTLALLEKSYAKARALAEQVMQWNDENAEAYYLAAEAHFWQREEKKAEMALQACLERDPLNADARFAYGYAIWRRRDITQLPQMAAQWEIALTLNPLHYRTHWHWGNGHTHLTYTDYVEENESEICEALAPMDSLIRLGQEKEATDFLRTQFKVYPDSRFPQLYLASLFYQRTDLAGQTRLDSAQQLFEELLDRFPHYGPAHNGLAAVIKQRQFSYLAAQDSLESVIAGVEIPKDEEAVFYQVFPDLERFPGERVPQMVWQQLYTGKVYLPLLAMLNRDFAIPPLHEDLSIAMGNSYFRSATTFDNRQWMDIRGVGSGATGIEYVERGAHLERNVTLHEYVHLFHGMLFSDQEMRRIRVLYEQAKKEDRVLDYYAANNEFEYLAQAFPAYFSRQKVHPLNHKAANVKQDLLTKDPLMYAWVDSLVQKHRAYIAGDSSTLAQNWAEAYMELAQMNKFLQDSLVLTYLDTAMSWDSSYVPTYLAYSTHFMDLGQWEESKRWMDRAARIAPNFAPVDLARARWYERQLERKLLQRETAIRAISEAYQMAGEKESDHRLSAEINQRQRLFYMDYSLWQDAIETAETYLLDPQEYSTYLRDEKDRAVSFLAYIKGQIGYTEESLTALAALTKRKPQNYRYQLMYTEILSLAGQHEAAYNRLKEVQELLKASGTYNTNIVQQLILAKIGMGDTLAAQGLLQTPAFTQGRKRGNKLKWLDIYLSLGDTLQASNMLQTIKVPDKPYRASIYYYLKGKWSLQKGDQASAVAALQLCLDENPYHFPARQLLIELLHDQGEINLVKSFSMEGTLLPAQPGPDHLRELEKWMDSDREVRADE
ncbi:MAG: hypothetical protein AAFQ83_05230 [Bacteroidota bacterium]